MFEDEKRHYLFADFVKYVLQSEPDGLLNTTKELAPKYYFYDFLLTLVKECTNLSPTPTTRNTATQRAQHRTTTTTHHNCSVQRESGLSSASGIAVGKEIAGHDVIGAMAASAAGEVLPRPYGMLLSDIPPIPRKQNGCQEPRHRVWTSDVHAGTRRRPDDFRERCN